MRYFFFFAIPLLITHNSSAQMTGAEKRCVRQENLASKDWHNKEMKYYTFGMIDTDAGDTMKKHVLKQYYNIELRHMGCIMDDGLVCYNKKAEKIIKRRYRISLWDAVKQTTDSINNAKLPR